jgi:hypothetical protein
MGVHVILHGFIEYPGWDSDQLKGRLYHHNKSVIHGLPKTDDDRPSITQSMFSLMPTTSTEPHYGTLLITLAASYKNMYRLESAWVRKFEVLLAKLCWYRASVFLEFGQLRYDWEVDAKHASERCFSNPPLPPTVWTFSCSQLKSEAIPLNEALSDSGQPDFVARGSDSESIT